MSLTYDAYLKTPVTELAGAASPNLGRISKTSDMEDEQDKERVAGRGMTRGGGGVAGSNDGSGWQEALGIETLLRIGKPTTLRLRLSEGPALLPVLNRHQSSGKSAFRKKSQLLT